MSVTANANSYLSPLASVPARTVTSNAVPPKAPLSDDLMKSLEISAISLAAHARREQVSPRGWLVKIDPGAKSSQWKLDPTWDQVLGALHFVMTGRFDIR